MTSAEQAMTSAEHAMAREHAIADERAISRTGRISLPSAPLMAPAFARVIPMLTTSKRPGARTALAAFLLALGTCRSGPPVRQPPVPPPTSRPASTTSAASTRPATTPFRHPGILINGAQLALLRDRVRAGTQPQAAAFARMQQRYGALDWTPRPRPVVDCGPYSRPNNGCTDERDDAIAAYTHALAWSVTGEPAHARKAAEILAAWAGTLRDHTGHNARLQAAWAGAVFPRAGEILRHTGAGWPAADVAAFEQMLRSVFLPMVTRSAEGTNGNWDLVMIEAALDIGVFLDDRAVFDRAADRWRSRVPAYIYMQADGPRPHAPPGGYKDDPQALLAFWHGQQTLVDGVAQETCRDFGHTAYGLASAVSVAETALQQGLDLYAEQSARLRAALELHAGYLLGQPAPPWLCAGKLDLRVLPTGEVAYNHFHDRLGLPMPNTGRLIDTRVRANEGVNHHIVWETFTHGAVGWAGLR